MENPITVAAQITPTSTDLISTVGSAMEEVTAEIGRFKSSAEEQRRRATNTAAATNAQTAIKVQATADAGAASQIISRELLLAEQRSQRNTLAVFQAAGGQAELLEEATKQFAASEAIDDLEAGIDEQMNQDYGLGFIDNIINEFRVMDDKEDIKVQEDKQVRAENNIGSIARITREASQTNQLTKLTATDATILATQRASTAANKIAIADAELSAIRLNAEAFAGVAAADGAVLDATLAGYTALADTATLSVRMKEAEVSAVLAEFQVANAPIDAEIKALQLESLKRKATKEIAGLPGEIESDQLKLDALRTELANIKDTNPAKAEMIKTQLKLTQSTLQANLATVESSITAQNATNEKVVFDIERELYNTEETASLVNIGLANMGQNAQSPTMIAQGLSNPNTSELYSSYLQSGLSPTGKIGSSAADTAMLRGQIQQAGGSFVVTPVSKAHDLIQQQFQATLATMEAEGKAPDSEEAAKDVYNRVARETMQLANNTPIADTDLNNPYLLPPTETLAMSTAVTNTVLWKSALSKMDVERLDTKLIYDSAVNLLRMREISPEQAATEFTKVFKASIALNSEMGTSWTKNNLPPQTKYMLKLKKPEYTYKSLLAGAGTLAKTATFNVSEGFLATEIPFMKVLSSVSSDSYIIDAADYTAVFQILNRDAALLGPIADNTGEK